MRSGALELRLLRSLVRGAEFGGRLQRRRDVAGTADANGRRRLAGAWCRRRRLRLERRSGNPECRCDALEDVVLRLRTTLPRRDPIFVDV